MTDLTTDVTVTIHGTEMELIAVGDEICPAEPDVGVFCRYIEGWGLRFADGTPIPADLCRLVSEEEWEKVRIALDDALERGDFEPDPDRLREDREEAAGHDRSKPSPIWAWQYWELSPYASARTPK